MSELSQNALVSTKPRDLSQAPFWAIPITNLVLQGCAVQPFFFYITSTSLNNKRNIEEMSGISDFPDSREACKSYKKHHLVDPKREFYIFFTGNDSIEVIEQPFIGIRGQV